MDFVLVGRGKRRRLGREVELEEVDAVAQPDELLAELKRRQRRSRALNEALNSSDKLLDRTGRRSGTTHFCSIYEHTFA